MSSYFFRLQKHPDFSTSWSAWTSVTCLFMLIIHYSITNTFCFCTALYSLKINLCFFVVTSDCPCWTTSRSVEKFCWKVQFFSCPFPCELAVHSDTILVYVCSKNELVMCKIHWSELSKCISVHHKELAGCMHLVLWTICLQSANKKIYVCIQNLEKDYLNKIS